MKSKGPPPGPLRTAVHEMLSTIETATIANEYDAREPHPSVSQLPATAAPANIPIFTFPEYRRRSDGIWACTPPGEREEILQQYVLDADAKALIATYTRARWSFVCVTKPQRLDDGVENGVPARVWTTCEGIVGVEWRCIRHGTIHLILRRSFPVRRRWEQELYGLIAMREAQGWEFLGTFPPDACIDQDRAYEWRMAPFGTTREAVFRRLRTRPVLGRPGPRRKKRK